MTESFTAGVMIFIEQFRARWSWSIGVLESWLSMLASSSEVPASSILRIPSPQRFVPGCGRHLQEWSLYVCSLQWLAENCELVRLDCVLYTWCMRTAAMWLASTRTTETWFVCVLLLRDWPALGQLKPDWSVSISLLFCDQRFYFAHF